MYERPSVCSRNYQNKIYILQYGWETCFLIFLFIYFAGLALNLETCTCWKCCITTKEPNSLQWYGSEEIWASQHWLMLDSPWNLFRSQRVWIHRAGAGWLSSWAKLSLSTSYLLLCPESPADCNWQVSLGWGSVFLVLAKVPWYTEVSLWVAWPKTIVFNLGCTLSTENVIYTDYECLGPHHTYWVIRICHIQMV